MVAALLDTLLPEVESRTQGLRPRTKDTNASVLKKKGFKKVLLAISRKKTLPKNLSNVLRNLNNLKNSAVLEPRTG